MQISVMMKKTMLLAIGIFVYCSWAQAQSTKKNAAIDSLIDYDALFNELDLFFDSLYTPKSFALISIGASTGYYNYKTASSEMLEANKQLTINPSIGYFSKYGPGINISGAIADDGIKKNLYQVALSGSYDYLKSKLFITGVSLSHYFTKDSLPFYTSPLQNEGNVYFSIRKWWLRPSVSASYGWGTKTNYEERKEYVNALRKKQTGYTRINSKESISDFSVTASLKHDFYWLHQIMMHDYFRVSPQLSFTSGTQKFGFNQTSDTYTTSKGKNKSVLNNSENVSLNSTEKFAPLNVTAFIKTEYSVGKFFVQPQFLVDYYIPANNKKISTAFAINAGVIL